MAGTACPTRLWYVSWLRNILPIRAGTFESLSTDVSRPTSAICKSFSRERLRWDEFPIVKLSHPWNLSQVPTCPVPPGALAFSRKKDPHPAGDGIFVPAGDLFPTGQELTVLRFHAASKSPISSLQAKRQSGNPEFPCAWKQLLTFWFRSPRPQPTPPRPAARRHSQPPPRREGSLRMPAVGSGNRQAWGS